MSTIGYATLPVIPSLKGAQAALTSGISGPATAAGTTGGGLLGGAMSTALLAGGAALAVGGLLAKVGADFDEAYDSIITKTGATGDELEALKGSFRDVFGSIPTTMGDASDAVAGLNQRLGITGGPLERLSRQVIQLSDITETDLNQNIAASSRVFGDWGVGVNQQSGTLDKFLRASQSSGAGVSDLMTSVVQFGSPLRNLGFSLDESIALFAGFEKGGVNASTAMSGMRQAVGNFAADGFSPMEGMAWVMGEVEKGTFSMTDAIDVFGKRAAPDMFAALQEGKFDLTSLLDEIQNGEGTIGSAAESTYDWQESLQVLKNKGLLLLEPIATRVFSALADGAAFALRLGRVFDRRGLTGVLTVLKNKFDQLSTPIKLVGAALLAIVSPWALVAAGAVYAYTHFEGFRNVVDGVARWLVGTAWPALQSFATSMKSGFLAAIDFVLGLWRSFGPSIMGVLSGLGAGLRRTFQNAFNIIMGIWNFWSGLFTGDWSKVWKGIKQVLGAVWNQITNVVRNGGRIMVNLMKIGLNLLGRAVQAGLQLVVAWFRALPGRALAMLQRLPSQLMNLGRAAIRAMREGISAAWGNVSSFLASIPRRVLNAVGDLGRILFDAGKAIIQGLLDGISSMLGGLRDLLGDVTGMIPDLKGPMSKDEKLLYPAGRAIMGGLHKGLEDGWGAGGKKFLTGLTQDVGGGEFAFSRNGAISQSVVSNQSYAARIEIDVTGMDREMVRMIQKHTRVYAGGDVQAALGS